MSFIFLRRLLTFFLLLLLLPFTYTSSFATSANKKNSAFFSFINLPVAEGVFIRFKLQENPNKVTSVYSQICTERYPSCLPEQALYSGTLDTYFVEKIKRNDPYIKPEIKNLLYQKGVFDQLAILLTQAENRRVFGDYEKKGIAILGFDFEDLTCLGTPDRETYSCADGSNSESQSPRMVIPTSTILYPNDIYDNSPEIWGGVGAPFVFKLSWTRKMTCQSLGEGWAPPSLKNFHTQDDRVALLKAKIKSLESLWIPLSEQTAVLCDGSCSHLNPRLAKNKQSIYFPKFYSFKKDFFDRVNIGEAGTVFHSAISDLKVSYLFENPTPPKSFFWGMSRPTPIALSLGVCVK